MELATKVAPTQVGHLLSKCMHDEDGANGLHVTNRRGDKWVAYGDGMLLDEKSKDNLRLATEAVQKSVDQVFEAYEYPSQVLDTAEVTDLVPIVDPAGRNQYPLFQVKDGTLHRRSHVDNLQDGKTTTKWWGLTTALSILLSETLVLEEH